PEATQIRSDEGPERQHDGGNPEEHPLPRLPPTQQPGRDQQQPHHIAGNPRDPLLSEERQRRERGEQDHDPTGHHPDPTPEGPATPPSAETSRHFRSTRDRRAGS